LYGGDLLPGFYDERIADERLRLGALFDRLVFTRDTNASASLAPAAGIRTLQAERVASRVLLPNYLTRMFGVNEQAARLRHEVLAHRLITLIGPGGAGKTRLAVETAHSLREHADWPLPASESESFEPFELIAFVPLVACTTPAQALDALMRELQIAPGADDPMAALIAAAAERRALLVLDNFEQLVDTAAHLVAQSVAALGLHLLVTSRRTLGFDGELAGCEPFRHVIKNDGSGGVRYHRKDDRWVSDGFDHGLTP
jgi:hypothetical protein